MTTLLIYILIGALFGASISYTIACSGLFDTLRKFVKSKNAKLGEGINCPWCVSHYVTLGYLIVTWQSLPTLFTLSKFMHFLILWFVIQTVIGVFHYVLIRTYMPIAQMQAQKAILEAKLRKNSSQ